MKPLWLALLLLFGMQPLLAACVRAQNVALEDDRAEMKSETSAWLREGETWMASFAAIADRLQQPLPHLQEDSSFHRHIAALERHASLLSRAGAETADLAREHEALAAQHARFREAYRNTLVWAQTPPRGRRPEMAQEEPR